MHTQLKVDLRLRRRHLTVQLTVSVTTWTTGSGELPQLYCHGLDFYVASIIIC